MNSCIQQALFNINDIPQPRNLIGTVHEFMNRLFNIFINRSTYGMVGIVAW